MKTSQAKYDMQNNKVDPMLPANVIWAAILDNQFKVEVTRTGDTHKGQFTIYNSNAADAILCDEVVDVSYGARFGPDISDVCFWQEKAIKVIDSQQ